MKKLEKGKKRDIENNEVLLIGKAEAGKMRVKANLTQFRKILPKYYRRSAGERAKESHHYFF
jgi:hypothetical protein